MRDLFFDPKRKLFTYLGILFLVMIIVFPSYADQVVKPTSGGTINVSFSTDPANPNPGDQTQLKISFINKQTNSVQQHIDYKVSVMEGNNQIAGIPITHTAEGSVGIPVLFQDAATYQVIVEVDGILFQPIPPETASFTVTVGTPSPSQNQTPPPTNATNIIKIPKWVKNNAKWWHDGTIGDSDFIKGLQYMIQQGIVVVPPSQASSSKSQTIPQWIKNNAGWWADGTIDDKTFVQGIQWLISNGIIVV